MKEILNVQDMLCNHCLNSIEGSVGQLKDVSSAQVDSVEGKVAVESDCS